MYNNNNNKIFVQNNINSNYSVNLDEIRFEIVLYFILSNSYKFTRNG